MSMEEKRKELEEKFKEALYSSIGELCSQRTKAIEMMRKNASYLGQNSVSIPNVEITVNNKLGELYQTFKRAGISMYAETYTQHSAIGDYEYVSTPFVAETIIGDLIDNLESANNKFANYVHTMRKVCDKKIEQVTAMQNVSPMKNFFAKIRAFFIKTEPISLSANEEEKEALDDSLEEYRDLDNQIWKYSLEDRIIPALVKKIAGPYKFGKFDIKHHYDASNVPGLLEKCVIPDLKKLGLEGLIPQLKEALIAEYKKDLPDPEIYKVDEKDMHLYVPDFSRTEKQTQNFSEEEFQVFLQQSGETITSLESGGISLRDMELNDTTVSAAQRRTGTQEIQTEIQPTHENEQELPKESSEITIE